MSIVTHSKFLLNSCIALNKKRGFHPYAKYEQKINPLFGTAYPSGNGGSGCIWWGSARTNLNPPTDLNVDLISNNKITTLHITCTYLRSHSICTLYFKGGVRQGIYFCRKNLHKCFYASWNICIVVYEYSVDKFTVIRLGCNRLLHNWYFIWN